MTAIRHVEDLTASERDQFAKAVAEGDAGTREWEQLMLLVTVGSNGNGDAYERRQAVRGLYSAEIAKTCEVGTCGLCGQEMIRTEGDCWHPWNVAKACPPEPSSVPWDAAGWAAFRAAGLDNGRPGREHFIPAVP